jgi:glyoxylase-like metal-dependent hydrolase (beta-lactamase superfamily II)
MSVDIKVEPSDLPEARTAMVDFLVVGSGGPSSGKVESSISLIRDGSTVIVIDPGMVADRRKIVDPLERLSVDPKDVTDVVLSHHHPDHTMNVALFPNARVHDHWAIYHNDAWTWRAVDGVLLTPSVRLIATPGHSPEDITTLIGTADGVYAFTHAWVWVDGSIVDPAADMRWLRMSRAQILRVADCIVPGHGPAFAPSEKTPR